jgi:hypothetical protein
VLAIEALVRLGRRPEANVVLAEAFGRESSRVRAQRTERRMRIQQLVFSSSSPPA